jgi:BlaI family penicillinase repressor
MSSRRSRNLSPANLEIMKVIWEKGEVTVNEVFETINSRRKHKLRRTTVQVQMNRLEEYGWLSHRAEGRAFFYSAVKERQTTRKDILDDIKNRVFGGSRADLVRCLLEDEDVTSEEAKELRRLIQEHKEG